MTNTPRMTQVPDPGVLILLPVLNEMENIAELLDRIRRLFGKWTLNPLKLDEFSRRDPSGIPDSL